MNDGDRLIVYPQGRPTLNHPIKSSIASANILLILTLGSLPVRAADNDAKPQLEPGFVSMFDGKTLDGWTVVPAKTKEAWTAEAGMIVGNGDKGTGYLVYENREIADFEMKLSYRLPGKGNSGINIRARDDKTGKRRFQSYHADLGHVGIGKQVLGAWDFHTPGRVEHACHRGQSLVIDANDQPTVTDIAGAVTLDDIRQGDWNDVHIIAKGNRFQLAINGKPASEFTEHLPPARRFHRGMIQLQLHDPHMVVQFKNIRIKVLR